MTVSTGVYLTSFFKSYRFRNRGFESKSLILAVGLGGGQAIHILVAPVLTRLFAPEAFGVLAVYMSFSTILAVVSSLRYDGALMITEEPVETANLASLCVLVSFLLSVLILGSVFLVFRLNLKMPSQIAQVGWSLYLIPLAVFVLSSQNILRLWWIRQDRFKSVSYCSFFQAAAENSVKVAGGAAGLLSPFGLILGHLAGATAGVWYLVSKFKGYELTGKLLKSVNKEKMWEAASRYRSFPLYNSWSSLINVVSIQVPVLMLGWTFDIEKAGFYLLAHRVLKLPLRLMGQAVSDALFREVADRRRGCRPILPFVVKVLLFLTVIISIPLSVVLVAGRPIFEAVFGKAWSISGVYATIMTPWVAMQFLASAISSVFVVLERNKLLSALQVMLLVSTLAPFLIARLFAYDHVQSMALLSVFSFIAYSAYGVSAVWICRSHDRSALDP